MARVLIALPDRFLQHLDKVVKEREYTRSEYIREALRAYFMMQGDPLRNPVPTDD